MGRRRVGGRSRRCAHKSEVWPPDPARGRHEDFRSLDIANDLQDPDWGGGSDSGRLTQERVRNRTMNRQGQTGTDRNGQEQAPGVPQ